LAAGNIPPAIDAMPMSTAAAMRRALAAKQAARHGAAKGSRRG
jgi:hypothetical protein